MSSAPPNQFPASARQDLNSIRLLHDLEEIPVMSTVFSLVNIVAAIAKNIFTVFVEATGCGHETLQKIKSSVYGRYLEETSVVRYFLGLIPFAISLLNWANSDYTYRDKYTVEIESSKDGLFFDSKECSARELEILTRMQKTA